MENQQINENKKEKKIVVMQILPKLESGGVERGTIDIAKALKKENFEPIVVSSGGILVYQLREAKIKHINLNVASKNVFTIFFNIKKIINIIRENSVDIVHVRSRVPMWSAYFACKKTKTRLISTVHGTYSLNLFKWKNFPLKKFYNQVMTRGHLIITVSNFIKNYLLENYQNNKNVNLSEKITVIHRGADLDYFNFNKVSLSRIIDLSKKWNLPEDKKIILFPARFTSWKGHEFLIEALTKVKNDFFCVMVGSDHGHKRFRKKIEQKIIKVNLAEKVRIIGVCKDMPVAYALSYLVVSASVRPEAFGRVAIESGAMSRPIVSTNIGGAIETIINEKTGFLVDSKNPEEMAKKIDYLLSISKDEYDLFCKSARKNVEIYFSNATMCEKTLDLYQKSFDSLIF
jgi:glycosyltransferase involved in cell wall biosynthesis